ncbi:MAG: glycosyltransferase involved in cell wall biosynthesis [Alteromonas naphthalenivorans]
MKKTILYLRTDICDQELTAGGSVAHTLGVIQGFCDLGHEVLCASSCMQSLLKKQKLKQFVKLSNPARASFLRWKINCFLSSVFFFFQVKKLLKNHDVLFIYQRYSLLNITGVLLKWAYKKKLILEYNGSEVWIATHWITKKRWLTFEWLMNKVEQINIQNADTLVVVSQALKDELLEQGVLEYKILVNPNGVDAQKYCPEVVTKKVREYEATI